MDTTTRTTTTTATSNLLSGLRVAVDVQHLFRPTPRAQDRGARYVLAASGAHVNEADLVLLYAQSLSTALERGGAQVLTNRPTTLTLVGTYGDRNLAAASWGAHAYLACHMNAGGGSYARTEHMSMSPGAELGVAIGWRLTRAFHVIRFKPADHVVALHWADRGAVCIRACPARVAAVIVEPCFGDNPAHQPLLLAPKLAQMGEAIAQGVADWWVASHIRVTPA